ncbi:hypothetical protein CGC53_01230 [Capnocytophaga leadbetteri]|uniref:Uncharacterized protein n=1 Tax=Capnocytophaga leadbetteri TaxID=327575 RepID=A0A250F7F8_9FLAO|nr:hypothetical protein CGC53_01230 [Capnocytophaga leadbetteri]
MFCGALPSQLKSLSQRERSSPQQTVGRSPTPYFLCFFGGQLFSPPLFTPSLSFKKCCNLDNQTNEAYISIILFSPITYYISIYYKEKKNKEYSKKAVATMVARLVATFFWLQELLQPFIISPSFSPPLAVLFFQIKS